MHIAEINRSWNESKATHEGSLKGQVTWLVQAGRPQEPSQERVWDTLCPSEPELTIREAAEQGVLSPHCIIWLATFWMRTLACSTGNQWSMMSCPLAHTRTDSLSGTLLNADQMVHSWSTTWETGNPSYFVLVRAAQEVHSSHNFNKLSCKKYPVTLSRKLSRGNYMKWRDDCASSAYCDWS